MRVPNRSQLVSSLFKYRVSKPVWFSPSAVQFIPVLSSSAPSQVLAKSSDSFHFTRGLYVSCPANFFVTNCIAVDSNRGTKSDCSAEPVSAAKSQMNQAERMKRAVKEYGATVIVFHTCISLFTLAVAYAAVSR